ncbi:hypothetical protein AVEN_248317-1, partial [Araneus ventricosus]
MQTQSSAVRHSEREQKPEKEAKSKVTRQMRSVMAAARVQLNSRRE